MYLYRNWSKIGSPYFITLQVCTVGLKKESRKNVYTMISVQNSNAEKNGLEKTHVPSTHCRVLSWTKDLKRIWGKWLFSNTLVSYLYTHSNVHTHVHVGTPYTFFSFIFRTTGGVSFCPTEILPKEPAFSLCVHGCTNTTRYPWP